MSEIKVDTLTGKTTANDITVTVGASATQSLEQGLAKAWYNFQDYSISTIRDSFGVSSMTDNSTGYATAGWTNNFANDDYSTSILGDAHPATHYTSACNYSNTTGTIIDFSTSGHGYYMHNIGAGGIDSFVVTGQFLGDLA